MISPFIASPFLKRQLLNEQSKRVLSIQVFNATSLTGRGGVDENKFNLATA